MLAVRVAFKRRFNFAYKQDLPLVLKKKHLASGALTQCHTALLVLSALRLSIIRSSFVSQILFNFPPVQELESNVPDIVEEILTVHDTTKVCVFGVRL